MTCRCGAFNCELPISRLAGSDLERSREGEKREAGSCCVYTALLLKGLHSCSSLFLTPALSCSLTAPPVLHGASGGFATGCSLTTFQKSNYDRCYPEFILHVWESESQFHYLRQITGMKNVPASVLLPPVLPVFH